MNGLIEIITRDSSAKMQYELLLMVLLFCLTALLIRKQKYLRIVWAAVFAGFLYLHRILLPFLVSGAYFFAVAGVLSAFTALRPGAFFTPLRWLLAKCARYTCRRQEEERGSSQGGMGLLLSAVIAVILLLQLCRINIAIDYDSFRYGLRSDVLLGLEDGLRGFFENKGLVNAVYVYPKGFELLTRPLLFGHTYGYVLCVNVWVLITVLFLADDIAAEISGSRAAGRLAALFLALMPGITNMALTAKTDLVTLLMQLIFVRASVRYLSRGEAGSVGIGLGALIASLSFKPTALIFSSVIGLWTLGRFLLRRLPIRFDPAGLRVTVLSILWTGMITLRTLLISGLPFAGVFTGAFEALGFQLNYPFAGAAAVSAGELSFTELLKRTARRLFGILFCPVGEDLEHVLMAWGGIAFLLMLLAVIFMTRRARRRAQLLVCYDEIRGREEPVTEGSLAGFDQLRSLLIPVGVLSAAAILLLYQIDGNYFMLLYALAGILGSAEWVLLARYAESGLPADGSGGPGSPGCAGVPGRTPGSAGSGSPGSAGGFAGAGVLLLSAVMIYVTAFTGWAGPVGFTPADPVNRGYYNHQAEIPLKNPLRLPAATRVVAFAPEPECYHIQARVESWVDIDGSGGNVYLTDTKLNIFKRYCAFAGIDYIYVDTGWLSDPENARRARMTELFTYLLEDGVFEEIGLAENTSDELWCRIDKARMAEDWEVPMGAEREDRTAEQTAYFKIVTGE